MSHWGTRSYDNDRVMYCIDNVYNGTTSPRSTSALHLGYVRALNKVFDRGTFWSTGEFWSIGEREETIVGIIMYALREDKVKVPQLYLMKGVRTAQLLLANKEYFALWKNKGARRSALRRELNTMKSILDNPEEFKVQVAVGSI